MTDVATLLEPVDGPDREAAILRLRQSRLGTIEEIWEHLDTKADSNSEFEAEVEKLTRKAGLPAGTLLDVLATDAETQAKLRGRLGLGARIAIFARRHGLEIAIYVAILAALIGLGFRVWENREVTVIAAQRNFPAYSLIAKKDLVEQRVRMPASQAESLVTAQTQAVGHYTLRPITARSPLRRDDLSKQPLTALKGRRVLSLKVDLGGLKPLPGTSVSLIFAQGGDEDEPPMAAEIDDVQLLALEPREAEAMLVVGVDGRAFEQIKPMLGSAVVSLVQTAD